jgi:hypothetical protein
MSLVIAQKNPLSSLLLRLAGRLAHTRLPELRDSQPDSIIAPSEAPGDRDYPDWLGYTPEIQRLLR